MAYDTNYSNAILSYLLKTWPVRFPEKIIVYLDIIENLFNNTKKLANLMGMNLSEDNNGYFTLQNKILQNELNDTVHSLDIDDE